ncbi:hypothetical protein TrLO_g13500 [Triparma laevis f. longispina]|uniref:Uncharacterized protein n=1 Tax=Triparma laevis f. longispina TaxID=1714387 RepID=A0A9W7FS73_9STRA|nr:hypothetical protein TrLO_g13500 [Triparma laevis f. longispina]
MSKSIASESNEGCKSRQKGGTRGAEDDEKEDEEGIIDLPPAEGLTISTTISTVPATTDQSMTKGWRAMADMLIDEGVASGAMMVHDGRDLSFEEASARKERRKLVTRVVFLLIITKVGENACCYAHNLVVVDIPEGVEGIAHSAFCRCDSLTTVSFPRTLITIGEFAFQQCSSLDNVDLLHTNLQELGQYAFYKCSELELMTIPDSLQTLGELVFCDCRKLVPSSINTNDSVAVFSHLRSKQKPVVASRIRAHRLQRRLALR